jgi:DNA-binding transcriptional LysR family regulator
MAQEGLVGLTLAPGKLQNSEKLTVWQRVLRRQVCHVNKVGSIAQIAAATDLIGLVPSIYAARAAGAYGLQVIAPPVPINNQQFHMIWHKRFDNDPGHAWLRASVSAAVEAAKTE